MTYQEIIKSAFLIRRAKNPFYSLRSFAKDLGLLPMHLSYILKGERGLSKNNAHRIAATIGLNGHEAQLFRFLISAQSGRSLAEKNLAKQGLKRKHVQGTEGMLKLRLKSAN